MIDVQFTGPSYLGSPGRRIPMRVVPRKGEIVEIHGLPALLVESVCHSVGADGWHHAVVKVVEA